MNIKKAISIILVLVWMSTVFSFSNQKGEGSSNTSRKVSEIVVNIIDIQNRFVDEQREELIKRIEPAIRKVAHYTIYAIGGIVLANCVYQFCRKEKILMVISTSIGVLYAVSDELHQLMIAGRNGSIRDVVIDSLGILTGMISFLIVNEICKQITNKKRKMGGE